MMENQICANFYSTIGTASSLIIYIKLLLGNRSETNHHNLLSMTAQLTLIEFKSNRTNRTHIPG